MKPLTMITCTTKTALLLLLIIGISSCVKVGMSPSLNSGVNGSPNNPSLPQYSTVDESPFIKTVDSAISTFSIDADGASYALVRKFISLNREPVKDAIRSEELMNYFTYNYNDPTGAAPIAVNGEVSECPWTMGNKLIRIGVKGKSIPESSYPPANFVFLIDVSGSMGYEDKLEILKEGFIAFCDKLRPTDRVAIVTYAGNSGTILKSTPGTSKELIKFKLRALSAGGGTNGEGGIIKAYQEAQSGFIPGGNNRVILGTDGDFNVGVSSTDELVRLIESKRDLGIFLTVLGVGSYNLNEGMMEKLANKGNGNYEYLDDVSEIKKIFTDEYNKFLTVAKDVKIQVEFNPELVEEYRLIGYENRSLTTQDFDDDNKDAGEIGAGQTITAIYEIKPVPNVATLQEPTFHIDFRYKMPAGTNSNLIALDIFDTGNSFEQSSENMRFASSLVALGMHLRNSLYKGSINIDKIRSWAGGAMSFDPHGYRAKHVELLSRIQ